MARPMTIPHSDQSANKITPKHSVCVSFLSQRPHSDTSCALFFTCGCAVLKVVHKLASVLMDHCGAIQHGRGDKDCWFLEILFRGALFFRCSLFVELRKLYF
ncbi:hypothetical protein AVEN_170039-1 [Araneus ventricosus]|uniref:Uncharacterized protein n=1 Tax=Araneus ventricosus TaxID=182803 RepID=A0A4Y2TGK9_ARAVE|nr:hypothetical protein AVEN_170039-1 [Araneus ventricosus]